METGILIIISYTLGLYLGNRLSNGKEIKIPRIEPIKAVKQYYEEKEIKEEQERISTILSNIENYDGTSNGQSEVK